MNRSQPYEQFALLAALALDPEHGSAPTLVRGAAQWIAKRLRLIRVLGWIVLLAGFAGLPISFALLEQPGSVFVGAVAPILIAAAALSAGGMVDLSRRAIEVPAGPAFVRALRAIQRPGVLGDHSQEQIRRMLLELFQQVWWMHESAKLLMAAPGCAPGRAEERQEVAGWLGLFADTLHKGIADVIEEIENSDALDRGADVVRRLSACLDGLDHEAEVIHRAIVGEGVIR